MTKIVSGGRELTHEQTLQLSLQAASGFESLGIGPDDAIAVMLRNDLSFLPATLGASSVGAFAVPVNWHFKGDEVRFILENSGAKALVLHADLLPRVEGAIPEGVKILAVPTPPEHCAAYGVTEMQAAVPTGVTNWDTWIAGFQPHPSPSTVSRGAMFYTSGTTGRPKGVRRDAIPTDQVMQLMLRSAVQAWGFGIPDMRTIIPAPVYHSAPNGYLGAAFRVGAHIVLQPKFDPEDFLRLVEEHRITHVQMVPTMFVRLLALPDEVRAKYDTSSLVWVVHAAAPCPPDVKRAMIEWWGPVIYEYYGGTEIGIVTAHNSAEALERPGTVGRALEGATLQILGDEGEPMGPDEIGEVYVGVEGMPDFTYLGQDDKRKAIERNGLISLGDVGYLDNDGFLFLCDRKVEMVISGGVNIYPAEIESVLIGMSGVRDCAVFGIPDKEFGEALCAHVEPDVGARMEPDDVKAYIRERMAGYKVPHVVEFSDTLPREDSGKIFKRKIRAPYWEGQERQI